MADLYYSVVIIDEVSQPGVRRMQDLALVLGVDMVTSRLHPTTSPKPSSSTLRLSFPRDTPNLNIRELMEVWAGWRDRASGQWSAVDWAGQPAPVWGGYILRERARIEGNEKVMELTLTDYGFLLKKKLVHGWPVFVTTAAPRDYTGYPPGYAVRDWLIGTVDEGLPFDGVLTAAPDGLGNGCRFGGVDPIFDTIIFDADTLPGQIEVVPGLSALQGYYGFLTLDKIVQSLADAAAFTYAKNYTGGPPLIIGFWMSAVPDGAAIVPEFHFANMADVQQPPDLLIGPADALAAGEVGIADYWHERDASAVQTALTFQGVGGDVTLPDPTLVYADYQNPDHAAIYPGPRYFLTPGWGGPSIFDPRLHTVALAAFLAAYVESRTWGATGILTGYIPVPAFAGQWARLRNPSESLNQVYPITSVTDQGDGSWQIALGFTQLTIADVLKGGLADVLLVQQDLAYQTGALGPSRANPGVPVAVAPDMLPATPHRNHVTAQYPDTPALVLQGGTGVRVDPGGGQPLPPPAVPAFTLAVLPPVTPTTPAPAAGTWTSQVDARPHPQTFFFQFAAAGSSGGVVHWDCDISAVRCKGTGTVTLNRNGIAVAGPFSTAGLHTITPPVHYSVAANDDLSVTAAGVTAPPTYYVTVSE